MCVRGAGIQCSLHEGHGHAQGLGPAPDAVATRAAPGRGCGRRLTALSHSTESCALAAVGDQLLHPACLYSIPYALHFIAVPAPPAAVRRGRTCKGCINRLPRFAAAACGDGTRSMCFCHPAAARPSLLILSSRCLYIECRRCSTTRAKSPPCAARSSSFRRRS